ncbi:AraC family ligand binding domain-containing protein [Modestobacter sp. I12A-02662]|uniref:AraC family ligand binding domain-containing protein n=1 Tax=Modestobacter sp. I12A-02662 TaxID=1730496 RepID=UPI0034DF60A8
MSTEGTGTDADGLARSCDADPSWMRFGPAAPGLERAEVRLRDCAFEPHRHDVYAIGVTTSGVQTFTYRGERRVCLPGQVHVLHPDETHDGAQGTDEGFGYRILYIAPELVRDALGRRPLPFVPDPVQDPSLTTGIVATLLADIDEPVDDLAAASLTAAVADCLLALSGAAAPRQAPIDVAAVEAVRRHLAERAPEHTSAATLEAIAGCDRWTLARQFRRTYGTSPDRYRVQRRLALARAAIAGGASLARAAADAGFADQSHLTRHFRRTYGFTPARWRDLQAPAVG